jgi:hypothetical protein
MKQHILAVSICVIGSLQMIGHLTGSRALRGAGLATGISPFPKVFCEADGYEPFAAAFSLTDDKGVDIAIDAERYSQLRGPYQRRNVYGAALAYAPRLPDDLRDHLFAKVLLPASPLVEELNLPDLQNPKIQIRTRAGESPSTYEYSTPRP